MTIENEKNLCPLTKSVIEKKKVDVLKLSVEKIIEAVIISTSFTTVKQMMRIDRFQMLAIKNLIERLHIKERT